MFFSRGAGAFVAAASLIAVPRAAPAQRVAPSGAISGVVRSAEGRAPFAAGRVRLLGTDAARLKRPGD